MENSEYTLLIVDDHEENRDMLCRRIKNEGFNVEIAVNGEDALKSISEKKIDLVLLDIMMPEIDGINVLTKLREEEKHDGMPVLMVTAVDLSSVALECMRKGACGYITKPIDMGHVRRQIRHCLELSE